MTFTRVVVISDTPEWEAERRLSVGASEVAAILGLSPWNTALDIWKAKKGINKPFDPVLSMIGHRSEAIIHEWVERHSGLGLTDLLPGFMARSETHPWLHASFDRVIEHPWLTLQFKTASAYTGHHWDEGIPTDIRIQVQAEMFVAGTERALVVVWIGGREFRSFWEDRDEKFIREHMLPAVHTFWHDHVLTDTPPPPSTVSEVNEIATEDREVDLPENAFETLERITVLSSDIQAQEAERDALKVALAQFVGTADTLTFEGRKVATWKQQKGRVGFDRVAFEEEHPELAAQYMTVGAPFRVLRRAKEKKQ